MELTATEPTANRRATPGFQGKRDAGALALVAPSLRLSTRGE